MRIAILGFGTVGTGVYDAAQRTDGAVEVARILARRTITVPGAIVSSDINDIINDASVELVVEAMGGVDPALDYVMRALRAGKHVVSANKQLICAHYSALMRAAAENGVELRFTASAGGGIPWLYNLRRAMRCDEINEVSGIVNGTTNYILDAMESAGEGYDEALRRAQELGFAEADPTADVNGFDAQRKCAISASIAFGAVVEESMVLTEGIQHFGSEAAQAAQTLPETKDRVVKLLMHSGREGDGIYAYVAPALVRRDSLEANVPSNYNLITLNAKYAGVQSYFGQGAGKDPTGTSVVQDVLDIASGSHSRSGHVRRADVRNDSVIRDFLVFDGRGAHVEHTSVSEMFIRARAARESGTSLFFGEIAV